MYKVEKGISLYGNFHFGHIGIKKTDRSLRQDAKETGRDGSPESSMGHNCRRDDTRGAGEAIEWASSPTGRGPVLAG